MKLFTYDPSREAALSIYYEKNETLLYKDTEAFQFILITDGTAIIELNGKKRVIMAPTILCLNEKDQLNLLELENLKGQGLYFDPIIVNNVLTISNLRDENVERSDSEHRDYFLMLPFIERTEEETGIIQLDQLAAQKLLKLISAVEREVTECSNNFWRCRTRSIFMEILFFIQYLWTDKESKNQFELYEASELSKKILMYLHTHYDKKLTLTQLTEEFHMNRTTLSEEFQKATHTSVMEYLIKLRIYMASTMIRNTELPINEIMYRTGFNDNTHFGRTFKKHTGCSPTEYRMGF